MPTRKRPQKKKISQKKISQKKISYGGHQITSGKPTGVKTNTTGKPNTDGGKRIPRGGTNRRNVPRATRPRPLRRAY